MQIPAKSLLLVTAAVAALLWSCSGKEPFSAEAQSIKNRKPAADFTLRDANGTAVKLSDYRGKVVLLNFWATWCGPCTLEIPWFIEFEQQYKTQGFAVIGVSMDEEMTDLLKFQRAYQASAQVVNVANIADAVKAMGNKICGWEAEGYSGASELADLITAEMPMSRVATIKLHAALHTCATLMHLSGVPVAVIAAWIGHKDASLTMRLTAHSQDTALKAAGDTLNRVATTS